MGPPLAMAPRARKLHAPLLSPWGGFGGLAAGGSPGAENPAAGRGRQLGLRLVRLPLVNTKLVGGLEHFLVSDILGIIIPIDFHIFQRGGPTTN